MTKNEELEDELIEKRFKELLREEKDIKFKEIMKCVDGFNPNNYSLNRDLVKIIRGVYLLFVIMICELRKERDEARQKLREYQMTKSKKKQGKDLIVDVRG
jgi:hypothetical protein